MSRELPHAELRERGFAAHERGELAVARVFYHRALALDPTDAGVRHGLGALCVQSRDYASAVDWLAPIAAQLDSAAGYCDLGNALLGAQRPRDALSAYQRCLEREPQHLAANMNAASAARQLGQLEDALGCYARILAAEATFGPAWRARADLLRDAGRLADALRDYDAALRLGVEPGPVQVDRAYVLAGLGNWEAAEQAVQHALALGVRSAPAQFLLALRRVATRDLDGAIAAYSAALRLDPRFLPALVNRAALLREADRPAEALTDLDMALTLDPRCFEALSIRAAVYVTLRQPARALEDCERAAALRTDVPEMLLNRGAALMGLDRHAEALDVLEALLRVRPTLLEGLLSHGVCLLALDRAAEAEASAARALALDGRSADGHFNRGCARHALRDLEGAVASFDAALALRAEHADSHLGRGNALRDLGDLSAALAAFDRALALAPTRGDIHSNRALALQAQGRLTDALVAHDRAVDLQPGQPEVRFNRATARLLAGDYAQGWREFEARWEIEPGLHLRRARRFAAAPWLGETPLEGRRILIHCEQGLGDVIQFCRYVPWLAARGADVLLEVQAPLVALLSGLAGVGHVIEHGDALPSFDCHCPLLSLPLAFGTTLDTIPSPSPYLQAEPSRVQQFAHRLGPRYRPRVGLVWSGSRLDLARQRAVPSGRNVPLSAFEPWATLDVEFVSLQLGAEAQRERAALAAAGWRGPSLTDYTGELRSMADTAALVANLDLVISVDTAVAHLAAALGKPVWILNRADTCWRWLLDRTDSPWYPSVRLYRQAQCGQWHEVLARVAADLAAVGRDAPGPRVA